MKFLEVPALLELSQKLRSLDLGDCILHVLIEAYSCKHAGDDKRLSKELHAQLIEEFQTSSPQIAPLSSSAMRLVRQGSREEVVQAASCTSPLGPMSSSQSRRLLIRLIGTLNATFPDYDFSDLRANQFEEVDEIEGIRTEIDSLVLEPAARVLASSSSSGSTVVVGVQAGDLLSKFWDVLDDVICLEDCSFYRFKPDAESDLFSVGKLWSINTFFYNQRMKKVVFFNASATSKSMGDFMLDDSADMLPSSQPDYAAPSASSGPLPSSQS